MEHRTRPGVVSLPDPNGTYPTCGCRIPHLPSSCDQSVIVDESAERSVRVVVVDDHRRQLAHRSLLSCGWNDGWRERSKASLQSLRWPGVLYTVVVLAGVVVSLGLIALTFPITERITGPEVARNE
jgi:hypothetical protein